MNALPQTVQFGQMPLPPNIHGSHDGGGQHLTLYLQRQASNVFGVLFFRQFPPIRTQLPSVHIIRMFRYIRRNIPIVVQTPNRAREVPLLTETVQWNIPVQHGMKHTLPNVLPRLGLAAQNIIPLAIKSGSLLIGYIVVFQQLLTNVVMLLLYPHLRRFNGFG